MKLHDQAVALGEAVAVQLFIDMLNPSMRGPAFTWDKLPSMAERMAATQAPLSIPGAADRLKEIASDAAKRRAEECLRDSAVMEWMPLGKANDK